MYEINILQSGQKLDERSGLVISSCEVYPIYIYHIIYLTFAAHASQLVKHLRRVFNLYRLLAYSKLPLLLPLYT